WEWRPSGALRWKTSQPLLWSITSARIFMRSWPPSARNPWYRSAPSTRCPFRKSCASALLLGTPDSSPAPEATLERGAPRENPGELAVDLWNRHLAVPTGQGIESHTNARPERAHPVLRCRLAQGHDKDGALAGGMRRKERGHIIV